MTTKLDLTTLTAEVDDLDPISRTRDIDLGQFPQWLADSKADGKARAITVPGPVDGDAATAAKNLIRRAATVAGGWGVSIQVRPTPDGNSRVKFLAKDKRAFDPDQPRMPSQKDGMTDQEYATALRKYAKDAAAWYTEKGQPQRVEKIAERVKGKLRELQERAKNAA